MALRHASITFLFVCITSLATVSFASDSITALLGTPISVTGPDGICKKVTNNSPTGAPLYIPTTTTAEWTSFYTSPPAGITFTSCATNITVPCTTNVNLFTLAGSPSTPGTYIFTIPSGCVVGSNTTSLPALTTGNWPAGSSVTLINNGSILGMGGAGGVGGSAPAIVAFPGYAGGPAFSVTAPISINNNGGIWGGGGGGGGGSGDCPGMSYSRFGGGGGGGRGYSTSSGGAPGALGLFGTGTNGGNGGQSAPGTGGGNQAFRLVASGFGGDGGGWGSAGNTGGPFLYRDAPYWGGGGNGGAAGPAITGSGYGITWLTYGDVRGPVQ